MRYGGKGLRSYPATRPTFGGRFKTLVMDGDMGSLFHNSLEGCSFLCAQNIPHVVGRMVFAWQ